jgi:hypothetical protein
MNKTTLPSVTISQVKRTHGWQRYFWPFQSRRALLHILAALATALPIVGGIVYLLDSRAVFNSLIGGPFLALYWTVYAFLPARVTLATRSEARYFVTDLQAMLTKLGYVAGERPMMPGSLHYHAKCSRFWRWDEQDIELLVHEHELVLNGPVTVLRLLRARLLLPNDRAYLKA